MKHGTDITTLRAELARLKAVEAECNRVCDEGCLDRGVGSERLAAQQESVIEAKIALAEMGWRTGFVGLCRLDGTPAKGRWIKSQWGESWGTPKVDGERGLDFIDANILMESRSGSDAAVAKLLAKGFRWETRRLRADAKYIYPNTRNGLEGIFYGRLVTFACDESGAEVCADSLVYPADEFFCDGAGDVVHGIAYGYADQEKNGWEALAALNAKRIRKPRKANAAA